MTLFATMHWWPLLFLTFQVPAEAPPWEQAPFETAPHLLIEAAHAFSPPEGEDVDMLLSETRYVMESDGTLSYEVHYVYKILTKEGVDSWSNVECEWSPWYQNRPEVRVRITNPDGSSQDLDPETLQESGDSGEERIYRDTRKLRAPFPSVTLGSIIEERIRISEHRPYFAEGTLYTWYMVAATPQRVRRLVLDFPMESKPRIKARLAENLQPRTEERHGRWHAVYELRDTESYEGSENNLPFDQAPWPFVTFTTGTSWNKVARAYADVVEDRLKGEDFSWVPRDLAVKGNAKATAFNLMDWLNRRIRYTGMELGERSLVPATPSECLERGYGDCKDKATMLVGMLRQFGIKAHVALLNAGYGWDSEPELPGLGAFNHAIVVIPDGPIWLDPTEEFLNDTLLPTTDQGRWALVAAKKTKELVKTPEFPSSENWVREKRSYRLPDSGLGEATVALVHGGALETEYRGRLSSITSEELKEEWADFVNDTFRGAKIEKLGFSDPKDLSDPLSINLDLTDLGRGLTENNNAIAAVMPSDLFDYLPSEFKAEGETRENPYLFHRPYAYRIEFEIIPPAGFTVTKLPEPGERGLGTGKMTYGFEEMENHRVLATLGFDSGKRLLSPEEFETYREEVIEVLEQDGMLVSFHHEGERLLSEGKYREALDSFRELVRAWPENEIHLIRLAHAFLTVGLGKQARTAAQKAVSLHPNSAEAHNALGWTLQHDDLGRLRFPGYDRPGAIAAYERALALDADHLLARADLAILLEYDENGFRYNTGSDLATAIDHYRHLRDELDNENFEVNLYLDMAYAGQFRELADLLGKNNLTDRQQIFRVVARTGSDGLQTGLAEVASISNLEKRATVCVEAGQILAKLGKLGEAAAFLRQAAKGSANAMALDSLADLYEKAAGQLSLTFDPMDPLHVFKAFTFALVNESGNMPPIDALVHGDLFNAISEAWETIEEAASFAHYLYLETELPPATIFQIGLAGMNFIVDGDPEIGYRLSYTGEGADAYVYLAPTEAGLRLVALDEATWGVGIQALRFLEQNELEACATWLGWMLPDEIKAGSKKVPPVNVVWKKGDPLDPKTMELAALLIGSNAPTVSEPNLHRLEHLRSEVADPVHRDVIDKALATIYTQRDAFDKLAPITDRLFEKYPEDSFAFLQKLRLLLRNRKLAEAEELALKQLSMVDDRTYVTPALGDVYAMTNDWEAFKKVILDLEARGRCSASDYNHFAWRALFAGAVDDQALEFCRRAVQMTDGENWAILHTLATVYAEVGRCKEARELLFTAMKAGGHLRPEPPDWLVLGRIAEKYGEWSAAREAYLRVEKPESELELPNSSYSLAQMWLATLPEESTQPEEKDLARSEPGTATDQ